MCCMPQVRTELVSFFMSVPALIAASACIEPSSNDAFAVSQCNKVRLAFRKLRQGKAMGAGIACAPHGIWHERKACILTKTSQ